MKRHRTLLYVTLALLSALPWIGRLPAQAGEERAPGARKNPEGDVRRVDGGIGRPTSETSDREATRGTERDAEKSSPRPRDAEILPEAVLLPDMGEHRAPKLLRLAGKLTGLPVRVQYRSINDIRVKIPRKLARRHVSLEELRLILASQSLFVVEWDHPRKGRILVATKDPNWQPEPPEYRRTLKIHPRRFSAAWRVIHDDISKRNASLAHASNRYIAVPVPRLGKIFLWGPSRKGLEELARYAEKLDESGEKDRLRLFHYLARFRKARSLLEPLLERLSEGEKRRTRVSAGTWNNMLIYRTTESIAQKIQRILEDLDRPPAKRAPRS